MTQSQVQRRQQAVARYLAGDKIEDICKQMGCSKSWLYKWKNRYQPDDPGWHQERSRRPARQTTQTSARVEQAIRTSRQCLEQRGEPAGAAAIQAALRQQGLEPVPSAPTIYRILRRAIIDHALHR
jgi:transposase-like protein